MGPAVMRNLVSCVDDLFCGVWVRFDRLTRREPSGSNLMFFEQGENSLRADYSKFTARTATWHGVASRNLWGQTIKVKCHADYVSCHRCTFYLAYTTGAGCAL